MTEIRRITIAKNILLAVKQGWSEDQIERYLRLLESDFIDQDPNVYQWCDAILVAALMYMPVDRFTERGADAC